MEFEPYLDERRLRSSAAVLSRWSNGKCDYVMSTFVAEYVCINLTRRKKSLLGILKEKNARITNTTKASI